ncbi:MAG TPA: FKBP-type peptidyl-prolyl cis-trans isomerase [Solirubrobacterales bacterium]|nr:FKBP-type peptidyl-prolyl cis-trans isomerase [Solirubrobacterales bacterium]
MKLVVLTIAICALLVGAGCGGSGGSSNGSVETTALAAKKPEQHNLPPPKPLPSKKVETIALVPRKAEPHIVLPKGPPPKKEVIVSDLKKGTGAVAKTGDVLTVDFYGVYYGNGKSVISSWESGESATFELGGGQGILGWEKALQGMRVGGRRELVIPSHLTSRYLPPSEERSQIYVIDLRGIGQQAPKPSQ